MGKPKGVLTWGLTLAFAGGMAVAAPSAVKIIEIEASRARDCTAVSKWVQSRGAFMSSGRGETNVVVLGDSYAAGEKLQDRYASWAFDLAEQRDWTIHVDGIGKTGFASGGFCGRQSFATRTGPITRLQPDVLIIEGGLNDGDYSVDDVEDAANATLAAVEAIPSVIVIGPTQAPSRSGMDAVDSALTKAAARHSRQYISALAWDLPFQSDGLHLTPAGHRQYAAHVGANLGGL